MKKVFLYSDGACEGNPGPGGWAAVLEYGKKRLQISGAQPKTTNNRMEMLAVINGLKKLRFPCEVTVVTDSQYLMKGFTQWIKKWQINGWKRADKKDVLNKDLWLSLLDTASRHHVRWQWIKGHAGHPQNELCDSLAKEAIKNYLKRGECKESESISLLPED